LFLLVTHSPSLPTHPPTESARDEPQSSSSLRPAPARTACYLLCAWVLSLCIVSLDSLLVRNPAASDSLQDRLARNNTMAATLLPTGGIALHGAPDSDIGSRDAKHLPIQAMQVEMTQDIVDEMLQSVRSGKPPQILFGRTPVCALRTPRALLCPPCVCYGRCASRR